MAQPDRDLKAEVKSLAEDVQAAIDDAPKAWPVPSIFADVVEFALTLKANDSCSLVSDSWDAAVAAGEGKAASDRLKCLFAATNSLCHAAKNVVDLESGLNANFHNPNDRTLRDSYAQKYDRMAEIVRRSLDEYWAMGS